MTTVLTFDEAMSLCSGDKKCPHLLLGNGFSRALRTAATRQAEAAAPGGTPRALRWTAPTHPRFTARHEKIAAG